MRQTRFLPMRRCPLLGVIPVCVLALAGWGCQQPPCCIPYGYGLSPCTPGVPGAPCCEAAAPVVGGATSSVDASGGSTSVSSSQVPPPRVVVSQPLQRLRVPWRPTDPEDSVATTTVEGAVSDSSVNR
jgi:hypothetical protein